MILIGDPDLIEVQTEWFKICLCHVEQIFRNVVGYYVIYYLGSDWRFLSLLGYTNHWQWMLDNTKHGHDFDYLLYAFLRQYLATLQKCKDKLGFLAFHEFLLRIRELSKDHQQNSLPYSLHTILIHLFRLHCLHFNQHRPMNFDQRNQKVAFQIICWLLLQKRCISL